MTMMRDYKMYTFKMTYTYNYYPRNDDGDAVGPAITRQYESEEQVVAKSEDIGRAVVESVRYKILYPDMKLELIKTENAPMLALIPPY